MRTPVGTMMSTKPNAVAGTMPYHAPAPAGYLGKATDLRVMSGTGVMVPGKTRRDAARFTALETHLSTATLRFQRICPVQEQPTDTQIYFMDYGRAE